MHLDDVIIAVASPPGRSARGIIRMSGAKTLALLAHHVLDFEPTRGLHVTILCSGPASSAPTDAGAHRDRRCPCLLLLFPDAHSYTGEPSAEIQLPGNPDLVEGFVDDLIDAAPAHDIDARRAEPGEFTARAFMNGRLDLTEAEGVAATISAQSDAALEAARMLTDGTLGDLARTLADRLAGALALVEAGIDFTDEEDVIPISPRALAAALTEIHARVETILDRSTGIEAIEAIPNVVLWGPPNVGKSTLFNALLERERTVVSPVAGTTRDVIREPMTIDTPAGPAEILLVDVAGHEDVAPSDTLHALVQDAGRDALRRADLLLLCAPGGAPPPPSPDAAPSGAVNVATKCDMVAPVPGHDVAVSSATGTGLAELRALISTRLADSAVRFGADQIGLRPRHDEALRTAADAIAKALALITPTERHLEPVELVAAHMRTALDALAALAGDISPDDVLGRIFASFCIGK